MMNVRSRGFALIYLLLLSVVIVMVLSALLTISMGQIRQSRHGIDHTRALLAAESGLAAVMSELERDTAWTGGFRGQPMPENGGTYTAEFAPPESANDKHCINNLMSDVAVDSYHGSATVPPRSALLIVTGRSGASSKTIEALVVFGSSPPERAALVATGSISLKGDARVNGLESLFKPAVLPAVIHSNDEGAGVKFTYAPRVSGDALRVEDTVSSSSSSPAATAIHLVPPATAAVQQSQVAPKRLPDVNIEAMLQDHAGSPGPPIPGTPTVLTLTGDNYYPGDVTVNGDVVLDGNARLLVKGNLTVNGSVKGNGALIVGGNTKFYGTADVTANSADYISVLSRGHVVMSGFQGETFMKSLTAVDSNAAKNWEDTKSVLTELQGYLRENSHLTSNELSTKMYVQDDARIDTWMSVIGNHLRQDEAAGEGWETNTSAYFRSRFSSAAPHSTEAFLRERFQLLDDLFRVGSFDRNGNHTNFHYEFLVDNYADYDPTVHGGLFDSVESFPDLSSDARPYVLREIIHIINRYDFDRLGSAEFKGYVYTSGALVVKDDLNLLGAVVVNGRESVGSITVDGSTYSAGDVALHGHVRLTHVQEMFQGGVQNLSGAGKLDVKRWVSR